MKAPAPKVDRPENRKTPVFISDVEKIQKMRGSDVLAYASDVLVAETVRTWTIEEALVGIGRRPAGWDVERAATHDVQFGMALVAEKIIAIGKEEYEALKPEIEKAKAEGKKPPRLHRLIEEAIEALRSGLIAEMKRRNPPAASALDQVAASIDAEAAA